jgi:predicted lipoprotein with Yx(FWY)xxD motif
MDLRLNLVRAAVAALLIPAACGGSGTTTSGASPAASPSPSPSPVVITGTATVDSKSTTILTDTKGMTLYYFTPDKGGKITCSGQCLASWPPLLLPSTSTKAVAGTGITGTLTTAANPDGKGTQVLYNNWPLYYYVKDTKAGDVTGQNVGGKWFVATPSLAAGT